MTKRILCIAGTRPEIIKLAPVVRALRAVPWADTMVAASGQHRELAETAFAAFGLQPDFHFSVMLDNQTLAGLTGRLFHALEPCIRDCAPDLVIAQGDTTTVMAVAMTCFYLNVPFAHLEAGLRTNNLKNPFPEELNRVICGHLAALHFAPTETARQALLRERVAPGSIVVAGNTVIDALLQTEGVAPVGLDPRRKLILLTAHRRENFGAPLDSVFRAVRDVLTGRQDLQLLYPVHPNPNVAEAAHRILGGVPSAILCPPLAYDHFVGAMRRAHLIVTDSGGVQEEAPALGKPVLVTREQTERPEAVAAGVARLIGTNYDAVRAALEQLLDDRGAYAAMARGTSPYGDGKASLRVIDALEVFFRLKPARTMPDFAPAIPMCEAAE
jgi:UDP-N-acetylglucosamine 2-epimerase (non-hydrolysing)